MSKYYGVWIGRKTGIYESWDECKMQIDKFTNAKYRKLQATTKEAALIEFFKDNCTVEAESIKFTKSVAMPSNKLEDKILTVDGAANDISCEYQGVWTSGEKAFASKKFSGGTNNIAEFLGLVSAIRYLNEKNLQLKVYTDSVTAMAWVKNCHANTTANATGKATQELDSLIKEAEEYLKLNKELMKKTHILKWETKQWGEIPADYGRK